MTADALTKPLSEDLQRKFAMRMLGMAGGDESKVAATGMVKSLVAHWEKQSAVVAYRAA